MMLHKRKLMPVLLWAVFALFFNNVYAESEAKTESATESKSQAQLQSPIHHTTAETCGTCHQKIYQQWSGSMHAQSTALKDPIHGAMYRKVIGDPKEEGVTKKGKYPVCLKCHAPSAALDKATKLDAKPAYNDGVTCVTCHTMASYQGIQGKGKKMNLGISAYEMSDTLQGPSGRNLGPLELQGTDAVPPDSKAPLKGKVGLEGEDSAFHALMVKGNTALLRSSQACLGCHDQRNNSNHVPLCMTGAEFRQAKTFNCQQCHMPVVDGFANHSMLGGHTQAMVERGVVMTMSAEVKNDKVAATVTLENTLPHNMPTGAPFRNIFIKVTALDEKGKVVWKNTESHPIKDDQKSMLMLKLLDADGKPTSPPKATQAGSDSRLKPHEKRNIDYSFPAKGVKQVKAELFYDLLLPPMKKMLKTVPDELKQSKRVAFAQVDL